MVCGHKGWPHLPSVHALDDCLALGATLPPLTHIHRILRNKTTNGTSRACYRGFTHTNGGKRTTTLLSRKEQLFAQRGRTVGFRHTWYLIEPNLLRRIMKPPQETRFINRAKRKKLVPSITLEFLLIRIQHIPYTRNTPPGRRANFTLGNIVR